MPCGDQSESCCISVNVSWQDKYNDTTPTSVGFINCDLSAKKTAGDLSDSDDLYEGNQQNFVPGSSIMILCNTV